MCLIQIALLFIVLIVLLIFINTMSSEDQDNDITIVTPHHGEYAAQNQVLHLTGSKQVKLYYQKQKYIVVMP